MRIFAIDDEEMALRVIERAIRIARPEAEIVTFTSPKELIEKVKFEHVDVIFMDINMPELSGIDLAEKVNELQKRTNIIFVTGYEEYALKAHSIFASGYVLKPIRDEEIRAQLDNLRYPVEEQKNVFAKCFGNFTLYVNEKPVFFSRTLSQELLAYLIDRQGAVVSRKEIASIIFEDQAYSRALQKYLSTIVHHLEDDLKAVRADKIFVRDARGYFVNTGNFECDMYEYLDGNDKFPYSGEYMEQYSWGENFKGLHFED